MIFGFVMYEPLTYDDYVYPTWANVVGWCLALSSMLCMPVGAVYGLLRAEGTFAEVRVPTTTGTVRPPLTYTILKVSNPFVYPSPLQVSYALMYNVLID